MCHGAAGFGKCGIIPPQHISQATPRRLPLQQHPAHFFMSPLARHFLLSSMPIPPAPFLKVALLPRPQHSPDFWPPVSSTPLPPVPMMSHPPSAPPSPLASPPCSPPPSPSGAPFPAASSVDPLPLPAPSPLPPIPSPTHSSPSSPTPCCSSSASSPPPSLSSPSFALPQSSRAPARTAVSASANHGLLPSERMVKLFEAGICKDPAIPAPVHHTKAQVIIPVHSYSVAVEVNTFSCLSKCLPGNSCNIFDVDSCCSVVPSLHKATHAQCVDLCWTPAPRSFLAWLGHIVAEPWFSIACCTEISVLCSLWSSVWYGLSHSKCTVATSSPGESSFMTS